nr:MAG TPA: hypothetical protein [Caudoviricetes sp.]
MKTLNEKAITIFKTVVSETLIENTYDERFLFSQLEKFWVNCYQFAFGWQELSEEIERQERYFLDSGFNQDEIDEIRFDASFEGMKDKLKVS